MNNFGIAPTLTTKAKVMPHSLLRNVLTPLVAGMLFCGSPAFAAELPNGTVVSKDNLDKIKNDTFMGHTIASLLTETMEWQIRNFNMTFPLGPAPEPKLDDRYWAATKEYAGQIKYDPTTRDITGEYKAGLPFPNVSATDKDAGEKIMWNAYYGINFGNDLAYNVTMVTAGAGGMEASSTFAFEKINNKGRLGEDKTTLDDPTVRAKTIFVGVSPQDVKGVGTYVVRYDVAGKFEDSWAYIKSARRTRRLSGSAWMDPVGGFDFISDDNYIYNARPSQYASNKLLTKRWILAAIDFKGKRDMSKIGKIGEWPHMLLETSPHFNPLTTWTPREVWVIDATPPPEHPYSKKLVYMDVKIPALYRGEFFDKKGEIWRVNQQHFQNMKGIKTGMEYFVTTAGEFIDYQAKHASIYAAGNTVLDSPSVKWSDWSIQGIERARTNR